MRLITLIVSLSLIVFSLPLAGQLYNDGAEITIQNDGLIHIEGNFTNQGGTIFNDGVIELKGDWINTVETNPLNPGSGLVEIIGSDQQTIGGGFNTLFYDLSIREDQEILLTRNIGIQNVVNLSDGIVHLNRNILHILNPSDLALTTSLGSLRAETADAYGFLRWDIADAAVGSNYIAPFSNDLEEDLAVSYEVNTIGTGADGYILFSTFPTDFNNTPLPLDVTNISINGDDTGINLVDRFWVMEAVDFTTAPEYSIAFALDTLNEAGGDNNLNLENLEIHNWSSDTWNSLDPVDLNGNVITASNAINYGPFAVATAFTSSVNDLSKLSQLNLFPNPTLDHLIIDMNSEVSEILSISIVNQLGQTLLTKQIDLQTGANKVRFDLSSLPSGSYFSVMNSNSISGSKSFIKL